MAIKIMDNTKGRMAWNAEYLLIHPKWIVEAVGPNARNHIQIESDAPPRQIIHWLNEEGYLMK